MLLERVLKQFAAKKNSSTLNSLMEVNGQRGLLRFFSTCLLLLQTSVCSFLSAPLNISYECANFIWQIFQQIHFPLSLSLSETLLVIKRQREYFDLLASNSTSRSANYYLASYYLAYYSADNVQLENLRLFFWKRLTFLIADGLPLTSSDA